MLAEKELLRLARVHVIVTTVDVSRRKRKQAKPASFCLREARSLGDAVLSLAYVISTGLCGHKCKQFTSCRMSTAGTYVLFFMVIGMGISGNGLQSQAQPHVRRMHLLIIRIDRSQLRPRVMCP